MSPLNNRTSPPSCGRARRRARERWRARRFRRHASCSSSRSDEDRNKENAMTPTATTSSLLRSIHMALGVLLLSSSPHVAAAASEAGGGRPEVDRPVTMSITDLGNGGYTVRGAFDVDAPPSLVWAVLSDYARIGDFVSSVRKSIVLERHPDYAIIEQEGSGKVFIFSKQVHVVL